MPLAGLKLKERKGSVTQAKYGFRTKPGVRHGVPVAYSMAYLWLTSYSVKIPL